MWCHSGIVTGSLACYLKLTVKDGYDLLSLEVLLTISGKGSDLTVERLMHLYHGVTMSRDWPEPSNTY